MNRKISLIVLAITMLFTITGCGKSDVEKFRDYLVSEAGYEEKNVDYYVLVKDGYRYTIDLSGSFEKESLTNTDDFTVHKVKYDFRYNKGSAEYIKYNNRCEYDFVLEESIPQNYGTYSCPDQIKFNKEMRALKETFDNYLNEVGIERLDLFREETE